MVTFDIQDTNVKMMVVRGQQVEAAATLPLEPGLVKDGVVMNPMAVGQRITELMSMNGVSEKRVSVGISGIHSLYRTVTIPKLPKNLIDEAARREAERAMPVPLNELYTSWQTFSLSAIEIMICLLGIPRNTIDAMLETLRQAGLQPEAMEVRPLALTRVTDEKDAIIINAEQTGFDIVVMMDGIPELIRSLPFTEVMASLDEKIAEIKEEMDRTIAFYNSGHKGHEIVASVAAFVSGELGGTLAQTLEYRVKPLPRQLSYADGLNATEYAANIGLALRQARAYTPAQVNLNITPEAYLPRPFPVMQLVSWAFILVAVAVLIMFGTLTLQKYRQTLSLQSQISSIQSQVTAIQGSEAFIKQLQTKISAAQTTASSFQEPLETNETQRAGVNADLSKVTSLFPGICGLASISYSGTTVTVIGTAPAETTIADYARDLRNSGEFSQVLIAEMTEIAYNVWTFEITCKQ